MKRIIVQNLYKTFNIGLKKNLSLLARISSFFHGVKINNKRNILNDVSFEVSSGEILGVIGGNGSGKSTLLRLIAQIYIPEKGSIVIDGKIVSLINLGAGFKNRLTMRENIFICCSLFGLSRKDIGQRIDSISNFADLQDFINTKLFQFSSGMIQRLAFSIAVHCNPQILLLDEVFEVGDEEFRKKSSNKIKELVKEGCCAIIVSHELERLEKNCNKIIWLEDGKIRESGDPGDVINKYCKQE